MHTRTLLFLAAALGSLSGATVTIPNSQLPQTFTVAEGDFLELLGNSLDNAYKWCRLKVRVTAQLVGQEHRLELLIEDDGPGIPPNQIERVLTRGYRADESTSGQGIGLSVVKEIVSAYQGELKIDRSELGGACLRIQL